MDTITKYCPKCGRNLPVDCFHKKNSSVDGLQNECKDCKREANQKSYQKKKGNQKLIKVYSNPELAKFKPRELLADLKSRGYKWDKMYVEATIEYEKV